jgi:hypothetical protein
MGLQCSGKLTTYFWRARYREQPRDLTDAGVAAWRRTKDERAKRLRELYDQGVPFFSKAAFRYFVDQLDRCRADPRPPPPDPNPHIISIPAIHGSVVECELEAGSARIFGGCMEFVAYVQEEKRHGMSRH